MSRRYARGRGRNLLRSAGSWQTLEGDLESGVHIESPPRDLHGSIHPLAVFGGALLGLCLGRLFIEQPRRISRLVFARRDCDVFHRYVWSEHSDSVGVLGGRNDFVRVDALKPELVGGTSRRHSQRSPLPSLLFAGLGGFSICLLPLRSDHVLLKSDLLDAFRGTAGQNERGGNDCASHVVLPVGPILDLQGTP